jgi:hypothetical protein
VPGAVDPAGSWDVVLWSGSPPPTRWSGSSTDQLLRSEFVLGPDGSYTQALYVFSLAWRPTTMGQIITGAGTYTFVRDTLVIPSGGDRLAFPYHGDTLTIGPGVYVRRRAGERPPTLDSRVRTLVAQLPDASLSGLVYDHQIVGTSGSDYCTARQSAVEDGLRKLGYGVVRDATGWQVTRLEGGTVTGTNVCRVALLAVWLDKLIPEPA